LTDSSGKVVGDAGKPDLPEAGKVDLPGARKPDLSEIAQPDLSETAQPDLSRGERAELESLRTEVADLRQRPQQAPPRHRFSWRTPVASILIVLGCLVAPLAVIGVWSANQVSDTSRFVANVGPVINDPAVQRAVTDQVTNQITSRLDVAAVTGQAAAALNSQGLHRVGTLLTNFAPSIADAVNGFIHTAVSKIVTSPQFASVWTQAITTAHEQVVKALSGGGGAVSTSNGQVTLDLAPFITAAKQDLAARGFTLVNSLPTIHPTFVLFQSQDLVKAQSAYRLINALKIVLPILMVLLIGAGVYVARSHRRALIAAGLGFAASMLVLGAALLIARNIYLNSVPSSVLPADAAAALYDTLVRFIREALRALLLLGLIVAAAAFLTGPSVAAVRTRGALSKGLGQVRKLTDRSGVSAGPAGRWTYAHRHGLRIAVIALAAVIFVFLGSPTAPLVITLVAIALLLLALIEVIGRPPARPQGAAAHP
jgi:hypothetical protein